MEGNGGQWRAMESAERPEVDLESAEERVDAPLVEVVLDSWGSEKMIVTEMEESPTSDDRTLVRRRLRRCNIQNRIVLGSINELG